MTDRLAWIEPWLDARWRRIQWEKKYGREWEQKNKRQLPWKTRSER